MLSLFAFYIVADLIFDGLSDVEKPLDLIIQKDKKHFVADKKKENVNTFLLPVITDYSGLKDQVMKEERRCLKLLNIQTRFSPTNSCEESK